MDNIFWEGIKESLSFVVNVVVLFQTTTLDNYFRKELKNRCLRCQCCRIFFYHCPVKLLKRKKERAESTKWIQPKLLSLFSPQK